MKHIKSFKRLHDELELSRKERKSVGFVPTMGALHSGHLALIDNALRQCDIVVCSIFVNPAQFNDKGDLENYPRSLEKDMELLSNKGCQIVFTPEVSEVYPAGFEMGTFQFNGLDVPMEGAHRPGHFQGMATVVDLFFRKIKPDFAFFGEKDFQQLRIVETLAQNHHPNTQIVRCPIVREESGLAMSSRNERLTPKQREKAARINKSLKIVKDMWQNPEVRLSEIIQFVETTFKREEEMTLEYFQVVGEDELKPVDRRTTSSVRAFIAVQVGGVRLIDNMAL